MSVHFDLPYVEAFALSAKVDFDRAKEHCPLLWDKAHRVEVVGKKIIDGLAAINKEKAKTLFNGPVRMVVVVRSKDLGSAFSTSRKPLSDDELSIALSDWGTRGLAFIQKFLSISCHDCINTLLDNAESIGILFVPDDKRDSATIVLATSTHGMLSTDL